MPNFKFLTTTPLSTNGIPDKSAIQIPTVEAFLPDQTKQEPVL